MEILASLHDLKRYDFKSVLGVSCWNVTKCGWPRFVCVLRRAASCGPFQMLARCAAGVESLPQRSFSVLPCCVLVVGGWEGGRYVGGAWPCVPDWLLWSSGARVVLWRGARSGCVVRAGPEKAAMAVAEGRVRGSGVAGWRGEAGQRCLGGGCVSRGSWACAAVGPARLPRGALALHGKLVWGALRGFLVGCGCVLRLWFWGGGPVCVWRPRWGGPVRLASGLGSCASACGLGGGGSCLVWWPCGGAPCPCPSGVRSCASGWASGGGGMPVAVVVPVGGAQAAAVSHAGVLSGVMCMVSEGVSDK